MPYGQFFVGNHPVLSGFLYFQIFLAISIPLLSIGFALWSLIRTRRPGVVKLKKRLWGIWIVNLILLISIGSFFIRDFASGGYIKKNTTLNTTGEIIEVNFDRYEDLNPLVKVDAGEFLLANRQFVVKNIETKFSPSTEGFNLTQTNFARAQSTQEAEVLAQEIDFNINQLQDKIAIPRYFVIPDGGKWRNQKVRLNFEIPIGQKIKIPYSQRYNIRGISYRDCQKVDDYIILEMTSEGLNCNKQDSE